MNDKICDWKYSYFSSNQADSKATLSPQEYITLLWPSFMVMGQKLWIFTNDQNASSICRDKVAFFCIQNMYFSYQNVKILTFFEIIVENTL